MKRYVLTGIFMMILGQTMQGGEIGFVEDFALSKDRPAALKLLIPGTEDYYYWNCLHLLNTEQYGEVDNLLKPWLERHGETARVREIRTRRAFLMYDQQPEKSIEYLRNRFGIHFPHQKEELNAEPNLPTTLDQGRISRDAYQKRALAIHQSRLQGFEDSAFQWLITTELNADQRREMLSRLTRPDYPGLVGLIADDLAAPRSGGFGSLGIHQQMLKSQLDELLERNAGLINHDQFVRIYLRKLQPGPDADWRHDPKLTAEYLDRLATFADRLAPVHNSLKAHILYQQLVLDRSQGTYNKERFLKYLALPRNVGYIAKVLRESDSFKRFPVDLNSNYDGTTLLPVIGDDEPLVRSYLTHFFVDAGNFKEYEPYIHDTYLKALYAETKIVNGLGDQEQWTSMLTPEQFRQLRERVDLDFAHTNKTQFKADEAVNLDLHIKNVSTLIVKVFEINTQNFYRQNGREVSTDINLDGLIANHEQTYKYDDSPLRRMDRKFEFPMLNKAGVYVIDFIGNGQSSRALIRKGQLRQLVQPTSSGQALTILDENDKQVTNARIWLSGHEYAAGEDGRIHIPFSTRPGRESVVITAPAGDGSSTYSSLAQLDHLGENYTLTVGIHVDRESLLTRKTAKAIIRPQLTVNDTPVSLSLLEEVKLSIISTDHDGTAASMDVPEFKLFEDRETIHEFQVPARLSALNFQLSAKVKQVITGTKVDVAAQNQITVNGIDKTDKLEDLHLLRSEGSYILELRGRTGEARSSRPIQLNLKHRDFRDQMPATLKTDANGRISLGTLTDISQLTAQGPEGTAHSWDLPVDEHTYATTIHAHVGDVVTLPYLGSAEGPSRDELSLLKLSGATFSEDQFDHLAIKNGLITINELTAGDYILQIRPGQQTIRLRIASGEKIGDYVVGPVRQLETTRLAPLQIQSIVPGEGKLTVQLRNVNKFARVHVFAARFLPEFSAFGNLSVVRGVEPYAFTYQPADSVYLTGRNIGDEYRYIIDRKYAQKYPGNMLERPSLLLNPWAIRETSTGEALAEGGGEFGGMGGGGFGSADRKATSAKRDSHSTTGFSNLDFLADTSVVLVNLIPNEEGVVEIPRDALGTHQELHVVAVDPLSTTSRSISLPEVEALLLDLRLANGLDPKLHFTRQKEITIVPQGQAFTLHDISTAKFEACDSLTRVFGLYATLNQDPQLQEFAFLLTWPTLEAKEKRALYSKYASHELNFFLFKKDPEFFRTVILPYLANKKDKTFMDHFLLEDDVAVYLEPWRHGQLNIVERILLSRRIDGEQAATSRHVSDLHALLPRDIDRFNFLFDTAVSRNALDSGDALGLKKAAKQLHGEMAQLRGAMEEPQLAGQAGNRPEATSAAAPAAPPVHADRMEQLQKRQQASEKAKELAERETKSRDGAAYRRNAREEDKNGVKDEAAARFFATDADLRSNVRQLFRQLEATREWAENNYHHLTIDRQNADLVTVNAFWKDYAASNPQAPFFSTNLAEASRNFPEMILALAVLDLPFESPKHQSEFDGAQMVLTPGGPLVVYHEEIRPAAAPDGSTKVLVSQNFFKHGDRQRIENGEKVDKFVTEEFLTHNVYGCQVVITNPTSTRQKLSVLVQIPQGALPVLNSQVTRTLHVDLEPYHTQTVEYHFYFPGVGEFPQFPVHVSRNGKLIAAAESFTFNVVDRPTKLDTGSWDYISQHGTLAQVVTFLETHNINELNLDRIAWRMHDRAAFDAVLPLLACRHVYSHTLWSYSLLHNAPAAASEYLQHADTIVNECGGRLSSTLLTVNPVLRRTYQHLEYKPLVNARAHALGKRRQIVNDRFNGQYHSFLQELAYVRTLDDADLLAVTYYLLLQDRVGEALETFARVNRANVPTQMQYDYCDAYLKFFGDEPQQARAIAAKYVDHPVDRWRNTFAAITAQLDEATGAQVAVIDEENRDQQQAGLAASEPGFDFKVESGKLAINYQNLDKLTVNFYQMDVELLFSRNPFVQEFGDDFASIKPNLSMSVPLPKDKIQTSIDLPEALKNSNVLVEIVGAGQSRAQPYFSNSLLVQVIENYGQVQVTHSQSRKPVSKAYVKVYAQMESGEVKFYKDGYTDLRGRFDYASLSTGDLDQAVKFSILILSDEYGALVREATPPKQ